MTAKTFKKLFFFNLFSLVSIFVLCQFFNRFIIVFSFFAILIYTSYCILLAKKLLVNQLKAKKISGQDPWKISKNLQKLCNNVSSDIPDLFLTKHFPAPTILSVSSPFQKPAIIVSQACFTKLTANEFHNLLAVEIVKIKSGTTQKNSQITSLTSAGFLNTFLPFGLGRILFAPLLPIQKILNKFYFNKRKWLSLITQAEDLMGSENNLQNSLYKIKAYHKARSFKSSPWLSELSSPPTFYQPIRNFSYDIKVFKSPA